MKWFRFLPGFCFLFLFSLVPPSFAQKLMSGPMLGQIELRTACIWAEVSPDVRSVAVDWWISGLPRSKKTAPYNGPLGKTFNPVHIPIGGMDVHTAYNCQLIIDGVPTGRTAIFTTKDLWEWRKPAPDFSFLTGSCAYFNEPRYDRPGTPYGGDSTIFLSMAATPAAFMLWLGDNWYTREADYSSEWGLYYRASLTRALPVLQNLWLTMPQYAIWDDHDYGPDDADASYVLKEESRELFKKYWCNPSYGQDGKGIYTTVSYSDVDIFLTDDRYFRSGDDLLDSVDGKPNPDKHFFGQAQLQWLKNALLFSKATFKIIAVGSQVLNPVSQAFECMHHYPAEYDELMNFLLQQHVDGVVFLSGDRHHSEVVKVDRPNTYSLFDVTASPLTSGIARVKRIEINSPYRVGQTLVEKQNYAKFSITGPKGSRELSVDFLGTDGTKLAGWSISEKALKN